MTKSREMNDMSRRVIFFDTTLRDGEQAPGFSMDLHEKVEVAKQLERMKIDIIEAGFAVSSPGDAQSVKAISGVIKDSKVASLCRAVRNDIDVSWECLKKAVSPRIHIFVATSDIHMKYKLKVTREEIMEMVSESVAYASKLCPDVQFSAEDACRSDREFLTRVFETAIKNGATTINIPDTVGYMTPTEMYALAKFVMENTMGSERVSLAVHCHNDLGMATANSLAGIAAGAAQVDCTVNGIGERAGNAALEEVLMALYTRKNYYDVSFRADTRQIYRTSRLVQTITAAAIPPNKAIIGQNVFSHESGIHQHGVMANRATYEIMTPESVGIPQNTMVLGKHSGRHAFESKVRELGYDISPEEINSAFGRFKLLADKKKVIFDRDIETLLAGNDVEHPGRFSLDSFVINSGSSIDATAIIKLLVDNDTVHKEVAIGYGPIDAAFKAINKITGEEFELTNYSLASVTEGEDALGEAVVTLENNSLSVIGRGVSTDVFEASIKAYINGVNKYFSSDFNN